ncbi:MAG: hypothetical protein U9N36_11345 [Euryarchaeota archaeon]|nr:hypothetical protein [Euryarchaeota archaeon]
MILDDGDGRRIARSLGIEITETIGLLLLAAEGGKLNLKWLIDNLMSVSSRLSKKEYETIISCAKDR